MLSLQLNQIAAMADVRKQLKQSCLVGCVGEVNAGKTTLIRSLMGLPAERDGHLLENATLNVVTMPMPVMTVSGLRVVLGSPMLLDTPGMFDAMGAQFSECALRHQGMQLSSG